MATKGKHHSSFAVKLRIYELLKEHLEVVSDGFVRYKTPSMTDRTISELIGDTTHVIVAGIRKENFGSLKSWTPPADTEELRQTVSDLITTLNTVRTELHQLTIKHDRLCQTLSLNKVVDARHLAIAGPLPHSANGKEKTI